MIPNIYVDNKNIKGMFTVKVMIRTITNPKIRPDNIQYDKDEI